MTFLRRVWRWLFGPSGPVELHARFSNEGEGKNPSLVEGAYDGLVDDGRLRVMAWQDGDQFGETRAIELGRKLWKKDGFYSYATDVKYWVGDKQMNPEDVPPGTTFTLIEIKCQIPAAELDDLEA